MSDATSVRTTIRRWLDVMVEHSSVAVVPLIAYALAFYGGLTLPQNPAHEFHLFLADHYANAFFELLDPRWYGGFQVTGYPPLAHQLVALVSYIPGLGLERGYAACLVGTVLLVVGAASVLVMVQVGTRQAWKMGILVALFPLLYVFVFPYGEFPFVLATAWMMLAWALLLWSFQTGHLYAALASALLCASSIHTHPIGLVLGLGWAWLAATTGARIHRSYRFLALGALASGVLSILPFFLSTGWRGFAAVMQTELPYQNALDVRWPSVIALGLLNGLVLLRSARPTSKLLAKISLGLCVLVVALGLGGVELAAKWLYLAGLVTFAALVLAVEWLASREGRVIAGVLCLVGIVGTTILLNRSDRQLQRRHEKAVVALTQFLSTEEARNYRYVTFGMGPERFELTRRVPTPTLDGGMPWITEFERLQTKAKSLDDLDPESPDERAVLERILGQADDHHLRWAVTGAPHYADLLKAHGFKLRHAWGSNVVLWENYAVSPQEPVATSRRTGLALVWGMLPLLFLLGACACIWVGLARTPWLRAAWGRLKEFSQSSPLHQGQRFPVERYVVLAVWIAGITALLAISSNFYERTYDSHGHMFLADHYRRDWFSLWDTRWYGGFWITTYPPLAHQLTALLGMVVPIETALVLISVAASALLPFGVYLAAQPFTTQRGAALAAVVCALWPTMYRFTYGYGQLAVIVAVPLVLLCIAVLHKYLVTQRRIHLGIFAALVCCTTSTHHVSTVFAALGCALIVFRHFFSPADYQLERKVILRQSLWAASLAALGMVLVVLPFWQMAFGAQPQEEIPHVTRFHIWARPQNLGVIEQYLATMLATLLFAKAIVQKRVVMTLLTGTVLGLYVLSMGHTTPLARIVFRSQADWMTYDKFEAYGSVLVPMIIGDALARGAWPSRWFRYGFAMFLMSATIYTLSQRSTEGTLPKYVRNIDPLLEVVNSPQAPHSRYLTLGFGDQFSRLDVYGQSPCVDGNYFTGRRDPFLRKSGIATLDASKFYPQGPMVLSYVLQQADEKGLRWIFVNDDWYYPFVLDAGFDLKELWQNGVTWFENPDAHPYKPEPPPPRTWQNYSWGAGPLLAAFLALVLLLYERRLRGGQVS